MANENGRSQHRSLAVRSSLGKLAEKWTPHVNTAAAAEDLLRMEEVLNMEEEEV